MFSYHTPVLLEETLEALNIQETGVYIDATFGGGGHSRALLSRLTTGRVVGFDRDPEAAQNAETLASEDARFQFVFDNYAELNRAVTETEIKSFDGILADLGVSSRQLDRPERGFSYRFDAPLDMRMDTTRGIDARDVLNEYPETKLAEIFRNYGEMAGAGRLSRVIGRARVGAGLQTTFDLNAVLTPYLPRNAVYDSLSKIYQAIRIEVNGELAALRTFLEKSLTLLKSGGRLVVIAYHSLEDRPVKNFMRSGNFEGEPPKDFFGASLTPWRLITRKPIVPNAEEIARNPRARSAKLRAAEKI